MPKISAMTLSGGKLSSFGGLKAVKAFRVWVHPKSGGDDRYYDYKTFRGVVNAYKRLKGDRKLIHVEHPMAIVWDKGQSAYREVAIDKASVKSLLPLLKKGR
jgi:hypothetical protein